MSSEEISQRKRISSDNVANLLGFAMVALVILAALALDFRLEAVSFSAWSNLSELGNNLINSDFIIKYILTGLALTGVMILAYWLAGHEDIGAFARAFIGLYLLASLVYILSSQQTMKQYLEYAFWGLIIGLVISNVFGVSDWLKPAVQSGFYVKLGLVLMGSEVIFQNILSFGPYGIAISWVVVPIVIAFMWWFGMRVLKMESPSMVMVLAVTTSVCGVSAAVAAAASIDADKNDLTFSVGISMIFTIVMMVLMPIFIRTVGMSELVGGAWIGNTIDSTGAVVLAGEALGPVASQVAAMIKMIQNVLIGFVSVAIAIFFARREDAERAKEGEEKKTSWGEIWQRLPKFIIGFMLMSLVFSFIVQPSLGSEMTNELIDLVGSWKGWCFCLTFLSIGLETNIRALRSSFDEGKPVTLYVVGQLFSLVLSLLICWIVLSGRFIPAPDIQLYG